MLGTGEVQIDPCPLCRATVGVPIESVPYARIWGALAREFRATFPAEVVRRHEPASEATLFRCSRCGLEYFSPIAPGDETFYRLLMASLPYAESRWDTEEVERLLVPGLRILDLGCGDGAFLRRVAPKADRVAGVDLNPDAIARLRAAGIEGHASTFSDFAQANRGAFDVAVSFHTLEHLRDASDLLEAALSCVDEGGRVYLSVPNRERDGRRGFEPLDWPPHHVSRWSAQQFDEVASRFGAQVISLRYEPLRYGRRIDQAFSRLGLSGIGRAASRLYTDFVVKRSRPHGSQADGVKSAALRGLSLLVELRRLA